MKTISLTTDVKIDDVLKSVEEAKEQDFLVEVFSRFRRKNIDAAIRQFYQDIRAFAHIAEDFKLNDRYMWMHKPLYGEELPDFVNANKL
nr:MAG TPA: hypothetical protein [Caudoviricetes sp.]